MAMNLEKGKLFQRRMWQSLEEGADAYGDRLGLVGFVEDALANSPKPTLIIYVDLVTERTSQHDRQCWRGCRRTRR